MELRTFKLKKQDCDQYTHQKPVYEGPRTLLKKRGLSWHVWGSSSIPSTACQYTNDVYMYIIFIHIFPHILKHSKLRKRPTRCSPRGQRGLHVCLDVTLTPMPFLSQMHPSSFLHSKKEKKNSVSGHKTKFRNVFEALGAFLCIPQSEQKLVTINYTGKKYSSQGGNTNKQRQYNKKWAQL